MTADELITPPRAPRAVTIREPCAEGAGHSFADPFLTRLRIGSGTTCVRVSNGPEASQFERGHAHSGVAHV